MTRLISIHGVCWGVGQSTLCRRLAASFGDADVLWEDELSQPAIFTRPEFAGIAERFHRHNAAPDDGVGHPTPEMLEAAYRQLVQTSIRHGRIVLLGWSVLDLAEDLDWARADERALREHARATREILRPLDPVLIYLNGDIGIAFDRAVAQRGRAWFQNRGWREDLDWDRFRQSQIEEAAISAQRIRTAFDVGGWLPCFEIDGTALTEEQLFEAVTDALAVRGVPTIDG